jgi:hypothetical protein
MLKYSTSLLGLAAFSALLTLAPEAQSADYMTNTQPYSVELNKTQILRLPTSASAVVIGNPSIADVSVHAADTLFIVGRGFGETNLIVLGPSGETIIDADVHVSQKLSNNGVRVYNRSARQTYNCAGNCQPSPVLGDDPEFIDSFTSETTQINNTEAFSATNTGSATELTGAVSSDTVF